MEDRHPLLERAQQAPEQPGVYQFQDSRGKVLYVGKAKHLRRRVQSYFSHQLEPRLVGMLSRARRLEFVVTATEVEALILENRLIKRNRPRYNVLLRDDKTYPYVKLTTGEAWPRAHLTRRVLDDGHSYFGPFLGHGMAARVMELIRTRTQVRTCTIEIDGGLARPCLYYDMGACLGPCVAGLTSAEAYATAVEEVTLLLEGRHKELKPRLEAQMWRAAEANEFERAARYRDLLGALEELSRGQNVEISGSGSVDVVGVEGDGRDATAVVLVYRDGKLVDKREFHWEGLNAAAEAEFLTAFLGQFYEANPAVPERVEVPFEPLDATAVRGFLRARRDGPVRLVVPKRGQRARVLELARENAGESFRLRFRHPRREAERVGEAVAAALGLPRPVGRIECFDISHLQGTETVASMVVFEDGLARKSEYRRFVVRTVASNDVGAMTEVLTRRFRRLIEERQLLQEADGDAAAAALIDATTRAPRGFAYAPGLLVVDGGAPQVAAARAVLEALGIADVAVCGLAKRLEEVWLPNEEFPLILPRTSEGLYLLQRIRDEAHRFAITHHRGRRSVSMVESVLDDVTGLGEVRRKALLRRFGSMKKLRGATAEEIAQTPGFGPRLAEAVVAAVASQSVGESVNMTTGEILD